MASWLKDHISQLILISYLLLFEENLSFDSLDLEILSLSYLSFTELKKWQEQVNGYSDLLKEKLSKNEQDGDKSFLHSILNFLKYQESTGISDIDIKDKDHSEQGCQVRIFHTGSIPEQFGKPLVEIDGIKNIVRDAFQDLESDHDMMMELPGYPVEMISKDELEGYLKNQGKRHFQNGSWNFRLIASQISKDSEFMHLYIRGMHQYDDAQFIAQIPNKVVRYFLKTNIYKLGLDTFLNLQVNKADSKTEVFSTYEGPVVNIQVHGDESIIFDADLLLALPIQICPR